MEGCHLFLVINVVGSGRKSGKTRLIEGLVRELTKRNRMVSVVKHIFEGTFDTAHKDTWKHLHAGANPTIAVSDEELVSLKPVTGPSLEKALEEVPAEVDVVFVEGFKGSEYPKILTARSLSEAEELMGVVANAIAISGPIASEKGCPSSLGSTPILELSELVRLVERMIIEDSVKRLPGMDCGRCGYASCSALAEAVLDGKASIDDCKTLSGRDVILKVDGELILLSEFPKSFVRNTVLGMIKTLRGVKEAPSNISLEIDLV